jgi:hypothetical protein
MDDMGIEVNLEDPMERDIIWRYTEIWRRVPRHRRTDQGWADLVYFCRDELERHRRTERGRADVDVP